MIGDPRKMRITSWSGPLPAFGEYMRSQGGSVYLVLSVRPNQRPPAERKSVAAVDLVKLAPDERPRRGRRIHDFQWNSRRKRR